MVQEEVTSSHLDRGIIFAKVGKLVYFSYSGNVTNITSGQFVEICKIPNDMIPVTSYYVMNCYSGSIQIVLNESGSITAYNYNNGNITNLTACRFAGSYISK